MFCFEKITLKRLVFSFHRPAGPLRLPLEADDIVLRVDFVREVDALLQEVRQEHSGEQNVEGLDPESVTRQLKQPEKQRTITQSRSSARRSH